MGECHSACLPQSEEGKVIAGFSTKSTLLRSTILSTGAQQQNEEMAFKTVNSTAKTLQQNIKESLQSPKSTSIEDTPRERTKNDQSLSSSRPELHPSLLQDKHTEQKASNEPEEMGFVLTESIDMRLSESLNASILPSHLRDTHSHSPKLLQPSIIRESIIEQWHSESYNPSNLFISINYDEIFNKQ